MTISKRTAVTRRPSALLAVAGAILAVTIAGCGGSSYGSPSVSGEGASGKTPVNSAQKRPAAAPTEMQTPAARGAEQEEPATPSTETQTPAAGAEAGGIPQHDGGDHDADNNGGPSDGDGNV